MSEKTPFCDNQDDESATDQPDLLAQREEAQDARNIRNAENRRFRRQPSKPYELGHGAETSPRKIHLASGYEKVDEEQGDIGCEVEGFDFDAHVWDCPACGSLLLAMVPDSAMRTRDRDPVRCPVCGDASAYICASHFPDVRCLIDGMDRMTDFEGGAPWV